MELRKGMWVRLRGQTGIYLGEHEKGAEVHIVDDKGHTTEVLFVVDASQLRQARLAEIPEARRPGPATAMRFGYN